jgi:hypothetical protein
MRKTNDQLEARIFVLESFAIAALAGYVRIAGTGGTPLPAERIIKLLDSIKDSAQRRMELENISDAARADADLFLDMMMSEFSEHLIPKPKA